VNTAGIFARTARNRLHIADVLDGLSSEQWEAPTLCEGWTVRHLAAHLLQPMLVGFGRFLLVAIRHRGSTSATVDHFARRLALHPPAELLALLRQHAADQVDPPRVGPMGPFADTCIHLRDLARPLGLDASAPAEDWRDLLDYLVSPTAAESLVDRTRLAGVSLRATDADWTSGDGPEAVGTLEQLAMAVTGRAAALDDLRGPGASALRR